MIRMADRITNDTAPGNDLFGSDVKSAATNDLVGENRNNSTSLFNETISIIACRKDIPTALELFTSIPSWYYYLLIALGTLSLLSLIVYLEEIHFILRYFQKGSRRSKTIWILTFFPVFTIISFLAVIVPRSGTLCDLVSNVLLVTCLYQFVGLMEDYFGGKDKLSKIIEQAPEISINTPPLCCCCFCLPKLQLHGRRYARLTAMVTQIIVMRPLLMFIAAVLWTNGSYIPGNLTPTNGFLYISTINLVLTLFAMHALMVLKKAFTDELGLDDRFAIQGKFLCVQLCLITSAVPNIVVGLLVTFHVIGCTSFYSPKGAADAIYHGIIVVLMPFYGILGRYFFRRKSDGDAENTMSSSAAEDGMIANGLLNSKEEPPTASAVAAATKTVEFTSYDDDAKESKV